MSNSESPQELSERGQLLASGNDTSEIFEVMRNLWNSETNPNGYVSLGIAENNLMHGKMAAYIEKNFNLPHELLTYHDGGAGSRNLTAATARFLNRNFKPFRPIEATQIVVTNGCSSLIEGLSHVLCDPGDGILLGQPYYRSFLPDIQMRPGAKVIPVPFKDTDPFSPAAVQCYESAIHRAKQQNQPIKALMLCHPHNPLGRCYPPKVLTSLMTLCQTHRIHLISDEIYALSTWHNTIDASPPPTPFTSALSIDPTGLISPHLLHTIWGISKDFGANGLRIGTLISQSNPTLLTALGTLSLYTYPSTLADHITATFLSDDAFTDTYISENRALLSQRYTLAAGFLKSHSIPYAPGANGAFFICADLGAAYRARHPDFVEEEEKEEGHGTEDLVTRVKRKLMEKRVFIVDSNAIGSEKAGWFRIVFSQAEEYLIEGLKRIVDAVEDRDEGSGGGSGGGRVNEVESGRVSGTEHVVPTRPKLGDGQDAPLSVPG